MAGAAPAAPLAGPSVQTGARGLAPEAQEVLEAAGRLAKGPPGARHVAFVLFNQHALGPRLAGATCCTDVAILRRDVRLCASMSATEAAAEGLSDDTEAFLSLALARRLWPDGGPPAGPLGLGDLLLALFEPSLCLEPILARSGLALPDVQRLLPRALRAMRLYRQQALDAASPSPEARALRSPAPAPPRPARPSRPTASGSGAGNVGTAQPRAVERAEAPKELPAEELAELADMAPRSAKRAAGRTRTALSSCGVDLVELARAGRLDPVLGRDGEVERVLQVLSRRTKCNCCLVGAPGVGKTAIVEAVAQRIAEGRVPPQLRGCRELWSLDVGAMLAGTSMRGDFEERLQALLSEARSAAGELVLFVDELHLLVGAGRSEGNGVDAANLLKPLLARGEVRCLGATTEAEYRRLVLQGDAAFERRFQVVQVAEPSPAAAAEMLRGLLPRYAEHHHLKASASIAEAVVRLSGVLRGRSLPDRAIDVLDEACSLAAELGAEEVGEEHVRAVVRRMGSSPWQPSKASFMSLSWLPLPWSRL